MNLFNLKNKTIITAGIDKKFNSYSSLKFDI